MYRYRYMKYKPRANNRLAYLLVLLIWFRIVIVDCGWHVISIIGLDNQAAFQDDLLVYKHLQWLSMGERAFYPMIPEVTLFSLYFWLFSKANSYRHPTQLQHETQKTSAGPEKVNGLIRYNAWCDLSSHTGLLQDPKVIESYLSKRGTGIKLHAHTKETGPETRCILVVIILSSRGPALYHTESEIQYRYLWQLAN